MPLNDISYMSYLNDLITVKKNTMAARVNENGGKEEDIYILPFNF